MEIIESLVRVSFIFIGSLAWFESRKAFQTALIGHDMNLDPEWEPKASPTGIP